jgi:hypothetical protein
MSTIQCPYCATAYVAHQPNCDNCGAPLPVAEDFPLAPPKRKSDLQYPPNPPREIKNSYVWRLLIQDATFMIAAIFGGIGAIFTLVGIALTLGVITAVVGIPFAAFGLLFFLPGFFFAQKRYAWARSQLLVLRDGLATEGEIVEISVNYSITVNGRNPWNVAYIYSLAEKDYEGQISTLKQPRFLAEGQPVVVLYLDRNHSISSLYPRP